VIYSLENFSFQESALDRPEISYMNPGKNDHFTKKVNGKKVHIQKRYLLWPLRDILEILNGSDIDSGNGFEDEFDKKLSFSLFYKFIKARKQYIFNNKIPQYTCLCEVCENAVLLSKGLDLACKKKAIPTNPHLIVEEYTCSSDNKSCMSSDCEDCKYHGLIYEDFVKDDDQSDNSDGPQPQSNSDSDDDNSSVVCRYYKWMKGADGYLAKIKLQVPINDALALWQTTIETIKLHIHTKRRQFAEIRRLTDNLSDNEMLIHLDYSENYKCKEQNEIQSAYFGNKSFSLFTACTYYMKDGLLEKLPITITSEEKDKSRIASMSCVNMAINHSKEKIGREIKTVHVVSDGCSAQFRSRFVFNLFLHIQKDVRFEWHYNEAHHGKGPMDGIGGTLKNLVHRKVMSGAVVINTPKEFADYANSVCKVDSLFMGKEDLLLEPVEIADALPIPTTLKVHKVRRVSEGDSFYNEFFYLSEDSEPFFVRKYGFQCGHERTEIIDENICNFCNNTYNIGEEWMKCPVCLQWYHEECFYK